MSMTCWPKWHGISHQTNWITSLHVSKYVHFHPYINVASLETYSVAFMQMSASELFILCFLFAVLQVGLGFSMIACNSLWVMHLAMKVALFVEFPGYHCLRIRQLSVCFCFKLVLCFYFNFLNVFSLNMCVLNKYSAVGSMQLTNKERSFWN